VKGALRERIEGLHPAYFAMAMATGVVSIACHLLGLGMLSRILFWLNHAIYGVLAALTLTRIAVHRRSFLADWSDHQRGVGFFTTVAATCILGTQYAVLRGDPETGKYLWYLGLVLWGVCMYAIFTALTVRDAKPTLPEGINGGWLTAVVATQSLCVLGCLVSPTFGADREQALFVSLALWLCGGMLYIWMISLIFYRYTFFKFLPSDLMPPYWINMGAMAISTLAGAMLIRHAPHSELLRSILPFLKGFTIFYWATATWWIPMLVILAIWRHAVKRFPLVYDPLYWGAVFPIGMYTTSTFQLAGALETPFLLAIPNVFIFVALTAWSLAFLGCVHRLLGLAALLLPSRRKAQRAAPGPELG
jgi:tellurite resistance protein TehA-like permease